jgi:LuxR family transcriptional regulator, maltose regulon positive regulatory protein
VADYLRSELLPHLSPDEVRFLTRTAVLERMSGPLCDAVLESSGSAAMLESLERSNMFLVPLDRDRQ